ncbi:MAG TPA: hypothetical protein VLM37_03330 [Fibrobacteraceae bacterium]|nr:hypothetical protein [Fibrobacteraceae bacterium]
MDFPHLMIGILTSALGAGYFVYGKRQSRFLLIGAGVALCVLPLVLDSIPALILVGLVLAVVPWFIR